MPFLLVPSFKTVSPATRAGRHTHTAFDLHASSAMPLHGDGAVSASAAPPKLRKDAATLIGKALRLKWHAGTQNSRRSVVAANGKRAATSQI